MFLSEKLNKLLLSDERWVVDGKLLKNKIVELAMNLDATLIQVLLREKEIKELFFQEVDGFSYFDKIKFQYFLNTNSYISNSFTEFSNRIGLIDEHSFIADSKNTILSFPYKDTILQGTQTKEDVGKKEVFWHRTIHRDRIDRLLDPKVFTSFIKHTKNGSSIPDSISFQDNFVIKGNNLIVLYSFLPKYSGKIKLIYIDPPYNTGSDSFLYHDNFSHASWLTFMKNRLEVAWDLLSDSGSFFIQVDDTEFAYLKVLCDEVFGRQNFREHIVLKSSTESGVNAINVKRGERLFKVKEHILYYTKKPSVRFKPFYTKTEFNFNYKYLLEEKENKYIVQDIYKSFFEEKLKGKNRKEISKIEKYAIDKAFADFALSHAENIYSLEKNIKKAGEKFKSFAKLNKEKGIVETFIKNSGEAILVFDGGVLVALKDRVIYENGEYFFGVLASDLWTDIGTTASNEGGISFNNGKKPEKLLKRIIEMTTDENDIVLDFNLGSGTTAAVAHKLKRKYIGIEQMDYGENDSIVRLQNVIQGDKTGISKSINWNGGGSFVSMELKKSNQIYVEKVINAKNFKELQNVVEEVLQYGYLYFEFDKTFFETHKKSYSVLELFEQKKLVLNMLDANYLYIPFSEIEDKTYNISPKEIKINKLFYQL